jgi:hypothetical protein
MSKMKFENITIISDMDGTLLDENKEISKENLEAISYFRENGGTFTVASGRIYEKITMFSEVLDLDLPIISHNGCIIYDNNNKKILHKEFLKGDYKSIIKEIYEEHPYIGVEAYTESEVIFLKYNKYIDKHIEDENFLNNADKSQIKWYDFDESKDQWCKILLANSPENNDKLEKILPNKYKDTSFVRSEAHYYEILPSNVNKGTAAMKLMQILDKKENKLYAIGDNMNDYELLEDATVGIAVKNASPALKKIADFILPYTNEQNAVAETINMIDKGLI